MEVTVLMSVYNSDQYLDKAINSILTQTYKDFEFIIIDDGSTDQSIEICKRFAQADSRIVFIENGKNLGLPKSLNNGILLAKGKYIARQDADDYSAPNRLEIQLKFAKENSWADVIGSDCYVIDLADNVVYQDTSFSACSDHKDSLLKHHAIFPHGSAFVKKEKLLEVGLYDVRFYYVQDGELWLRMISKNAKVHVINELLYYYRVGPNGSVKRNNAKLMFNKILRMNYAENKSVELIDKELAHVKAYLTHSKLVIKPHFMADYWRSLGNASYLRNSDKKLPHAYINKAISETNSFTNYPKYMLLKIVYMLPSNFVKMFLKFKGA
ncbi:glycosyltransferase involved in cell wall biosynthesis [Flavobacterium sp. W4I14]|nr:glycosyltransferase involved in cell wall biosynthesis [Flavobacterium sp. W4I14]